MFYNDRFEVNIRFLRHSYLNRRHVGIPLKGFSIPGKQWILKLAKLHEKYCLSLRFPLPQSILFYFIF